MWRELPWMGIGQRWDGPEDDHRLRFLGDGLSYVEPALPASLEALPAGTPTLAHSSELALATSGQLNSTMLAALCGQVRALDPPWAGEHFCLGSVIDTGELGYNFAPLLDRATLDATVENVTRVQQAYRCPVAIEAGPRYFGWDDRWDDHGLMLEVARRTDAALIVDVSHHLCSMLNLGRDPRDGLGPEVLERTIEVHITGIGAHRTPGYHHDCHDVPVSEPAWTLLSWVLDRCPHLKAVTLEHSCRVSENAYERDLRRLQVLVDRRSPS